MNITILQLFSQDKSKNNFLRHSHWNIEKLQEWP